MVTSIGKTVSSLVERSTYLLGIKKPSIVKNIDKYDREYGTVIDAKTGQKVPVFVTFYHPPYKPPQIVHMYASLDGYSLGGAVLEVNDGSGVVKIKEIEVGKEYVSDFECVNYFEGTDRCLIHAIRRFALENGITQIEIEDENIPKEFLDDEMDIPQRNNYLRRFKQVNGQSSYLPLRYLVMDDFENPAHVFLSKTKSVYLPHGAQINGVIRRRMKELAPSVPFQIESIDQTKETIDSTIYGKALELVSQKEFDGINYSMGSETDYRQFSEEENDFVYSGNLLANREFVKSLLPVKHISGKANLEVISWLEKLALKVPFYVSASNEGTVKFNTFALAEGINIVGGHLEDGTKWEKSSTDVPEAKYALCSWRAFPVFNRWGKLKGASLGEDKTVDIPRSEIKTTGIRAMLPWKSYPNDGVPFQGTSQASPCRMVEDALLRRGIIELA